MPDEAGETQVPKQPEPRAETATEEVKKEVVVDDRGVVHTDREEIEDLKKR